MNLIRCVSGVKKDGMALDTMIQQPAGPLYGGTTPFCNHMPLIQGYLIPEPHQTWPFYFIVTFIIGYAVAKIILGQLLSSTSMATVRYNYATSMFKDNSQLQRQRDLVLFSFYFLNTAFFLMLLAENVNIFPYRLTGFGLFSFFIMLLFVLFFGRIVLTTITGHLFLISGLLKEHLYLGYIYNKMIGILLLPLNFIIMYTPDIVSQIMIYFALFIMASLLLMKVLRGITFIRKHRIFNFYLFLYLCALEIVPLLLLYKWFTRIV